jgi:hypothetical protein
MDGLPEVYHREDSMASEIKIRWDGDVPGVAEHRLSLAAFGEPLNQLLLALRRIATQLVSTAVEHERPQIGRFANLARQLDIEIISVEGNSTGINGLVSFAQPPDELPLFADLPNRSIAEFMDSMERESRGEPSNWAVRKYLRAMPLAIHTQTYELYENNALKKTTRIGDIKFAEVPEDFPSFREIEGHIIGVGFEPGRSEVRIKGETTAIAFDASDESVEKAITIRKEEVRLLGVSDGKRSRLLRIDKVSEPRFAVSPKAIEEHIFSRWGGVFARLAE